MQTLNIKWKNRLVVLLAIILFGYLAICFYIYSVQKQIVFPSHYTAPVPLTWSPTGKGSEQALLKGQCGHLHAAFWKTEQAKGTIMLFHGNGESLASIDDYVFAFHRLGYNLMSWDYPGYGQSVDCNFSESMLLSDAEAAYQWLNKIEDAKKIYLFGYSLGTGIALSVAAKHQHNPVYLVAAYDALSEVAKDRFSRFLPVDLFFKYPMETKNWIEAIKQPIYLIHGTQDKVILPKRAKSLTINPNVKLEWVENAAHASNNLFEYRNQWLKRLLP